LLLAALASLALAAAWPLVRPVHAPFFRAWAEFAVRFLDPLPAQVSARFEAGSDPVLKKDLPLQDTVVTLSHSALEGRSGTFAASSFSHAWLATSVLCALFAAATPRPWRARRWPFLAALALLHAFVALRCALAVVYAYAKSTVDGELLVPLERPSARALYLLWHFGWDERLTDVLVPLVLWALCVFAPRSRPLPTRSPG
jgi:hypothetical protein